MSSNSRRSLVAGSLVLAAALALVPAGQAARRERAPRAPAAPADDSTRAANTIVHEIRALYGGDDNFAELDGLRYYVTFTIPGPDGAPVRSWTETHAVWMHDPPRVRIDTDVDSTIVIVSADTTRLFRDGEWRTEPKLAAAARDQALDALWFWRLPRALVEPRLHPRLLDEVTRDRPFRVRYRYDAPGLGRPVGTELIVTFAPPTYTMRTLHWYDPRTRAWFLLELADDRRRYDWTWPERRTLRASNAAGEAGPIVWTALVQDMQLEGRMPAILLSPPGAGPGVLAPPPTPPVAPVVPAAADSASREGAHGRL